MGKHSSDEEEAHKKKRKKHSSDSDRESKKKKKKHKSKGDKKKHKKKSKKVSSSSSDSSDSERETTKQVKALPKEPVKEEKDVSMKEVDEILLAMLARYPASSQELQFLFFKLEKDQVVDIRDLTDVFIKKSLKSAFQLLHVERTKGGYQRSERTPPLLTVVERAIKASSSTPSSDAPSSSSSSSASSASSSSSAASSSSSAASSSSSAASSSSASIPSPFAPPPRSVGPALPSAEQRLLAAKLQQEAELEDSVPDFGPKMVEQMTDQERQANETLQMSREVGSYYKRQAQETAASLPKHDEWMTVLPAEFKRDPLEITTRKFSMEAKVSRGDTSQWTDTPLEREARGMERLRTEAEKDAVLAELMSGAPEVKKRSVNATPEEAAAAAQAMLAARSGQNRPPVAEEKEETAAERERREFKEFCAKKKAEERKRKELRAMQKEAAAKPWDREEAFKSVRRLKGVAEQEREISEASKLMGSFVDAGAQSSFL